MSNTIYDRIREENMRKYGTQVSVYGPVLLANLYSDRTHFIYELLQNAEDACERARKQGQTNRFTIRFELYPDRLEVRHNGIPFDENDLRGICGIVEAIKDKNIAQIGKFGIGFKSVYAYTSSPEIYSGDKSFYIKDYVHPYLKEPRKDIQTGETLFVIRFDKIKKELAYSEIENRLRNLGVRTLLFLRNLEEISCNMGSKNGKYLRSSEGETGAKKVALQYFETGQEKRKERWLIFEKFLDKEKNRRLEIAYQIVYDDNLKNWRINPAKDVKLFVYFPTEKETHLKFLIQGPYNTTPARDNIRDDEWNRRLVEETAMFVADSIPRIKEIGLLNAEFLNTLPIETDHFTNEVTMFKPVYKRVKDKLSSKEALLPTYDGNFVTANQAFIARGKDLHVLLSSEQLDWLFERKGSRWLDENITEDRTPELREYLIKELGVEEVDPELFARTFDEEFICKQDDQWVISFYSFLLNQKALWKNADYSYERPGILRSKPIIRLQDNSHIAPFDDDGRPIAYLAHKDESINKMFSHIVKETVLADKTAREFLKSLGINEPDRTAAIFELILPNYKGAPIVSQEDNLQHVEWILKTIEESVNTKIDTLLDELKKTPFFYAVNALDQRKEYRTPTEIHLGEKYTDNNNLEIFFEGNEDAWFLDARYLALENIDKLTEKFRQIGCRSGIAISPDRKPNYLGHVMITDSHGWHKRGLDGFEPDREIEGLEYALKNINIERAKILWQVAKECRRCISGEVESCPRHNFEGSTKKWQYSKMGELLVEYAWLPDSSLSFHKPNELMLSQLPDNFDKESTEAKYVSEKLGMKPMISQELQAILEKTPEEAREIVEIFVSASPELKQHILETIRTIKSSERRYPEMETTDTTTTKITVSPSPAELHSEFRQALIQEGLSSIPTEDKTWTGPTPEQEEKMQQFESEALAKMLKERRIVEKERKEVSFIRSEEDEESELREFLLEQYKGHCQVCNTKLDLGPNKNPYFEIYRLIEKRREVGSWSDLKFNALCLCPNCHALMKYGGRDLKQIFDKAIELAKGETAPEESKERGGDFYTVQITVAGKEKELSYAPFHMAKIAAFVKLAESDEQKNAHASLLEEHPKILSYICSKCGNTYSGEEYERDPFCRKCGSWLKHV